MKNPWMSMWLSAANSYASAARGVAAAETRRTQNAMIDEMTRQTMAFWFPPGLRQATPAAKPRRRRRASSKS